MGSNNTDVGGCEPANRLASWEILSPSAAKALVSPALAAVRADLLAVVPVAIIGPTTFDLCSPTVAVTLPLRGVSGSYRAAKLKTAARLYDGSKDTDALRLTCLPAPG